MSYTIIRNQKSKLILLYYIIFIISATIINTVNSQQNNEIQIDFKIFDQFPEYNNNFGNNARGSVVKGMVKSTLGNNKIPTLDNGSSLPSPSLFSKFFSTSHDARQPGLNKPLSKTITLTLDKNTGNYVYSSSPFFLIDNLGFDSNTTYRKFKDSSNNYHNYHYCLAFNYLLSYSQSDKFIFTGNDDVFIYLNNQLVSDFGGVKDSITTTVDLSKYSLIKGNVYPFDFYYCERSTASTPTFKIETNINFYCKADDYCGVCMGDGGSCCNPSINCKKEIMYEDGSMGDNLCTIDSCPQLNTEIDPNIDISEYCDHFPFPDPYAGSACYEGVCNPFTGTWLKNMTICANLTAKCLINSPKKYCDDVNGCQYETKCNDVCDRGAGETNCKNGICVPKSSIDCITELEGVGNKADPCFTYICESGIGCTKKPVCPRSSDPCIDNQCKAGVCTKIDIPSDKCECDCPAKNMCNKKVCITDKNCTVSILDEIDDGNACTEDLCDPETGIITHVPYNKCSGCNICNPANGKCQSLDTLCNDANNCTEDVCVQSKDNLNVGVCTQRPTTKCDKGDPCKIYTCTNNSCNETARVCPDNGVCNIGYCEAGVGCKLKPRECKSDYFCIESQCDEQFGCVQFEKRCAPDNGNCERGICINNTAIGVDDGECISEEFDPKPFICKTAAVVSTAVIAGVVVAGAVALGAAIFAGKKGYDAWMTSQNNPMAASTQNPLYEENARGRGENPLYNS